MDGVHKTQSEIQFLNSTLASAGASYGRSLVFAQDVSASINNDYRGIDGDIDLTDSTGGGGLIFGVASVSYDDVDTPGTSVNLTGWSAQGSVGATGATVSRFNGYQSQLGSLASGSTFDSVHHYEAYLAGAASDSSEYGFIVSGTGDAESFAFYNATDSPSYFGGDVGIGTTTPSHPLTVHANPGAANTPVAWIHNSGNVADYDGTVISTVNDGSDAEVLHVRTNTTTSNGGTSLMLVRGDGNVGIGTTTPANKLTINQGSLELTGSGSFSGSGEGINHQGDDGLGFVTAGNVRATIDSTGNVGIGTTAPLAKTHIQTGVSGLVGALSVNYDEFCIEGGVGSNVGMTILAKNTNNSGISFADEDSNFQGGVVYKHSADSLGLWANGVEKLLIESGGKVIINQPTSGKAFEVNMADNSSSDILFQQGSNEYFAIDTTNGLELLTYGNTTTNPDHVFLGGNVGIGTTTPSELLEVSKNQNNVTAIQVTNENTGSSVRSDLQLANNVNTAYIAYNGTANTALGGANSLNLYNGANAPIAFFTNGTSEKMRITGAGNVGIGTTTPATALDVNGAATIQTLATSTSDSVVTENSGVLEKRTIASTAWAASFTEGSVPFSDSSGDLTEDNTNLFWNDTDKTLKAGKAIMGTWELGANEAVFANSGLDLSDSGNYGVIHQSTGRLLLNAPTGQSLRFRINNADIATLTSTGLGIGTTSPVSVFQVVKTGAGIQENVTVTNEETAALGVGSSVRFSGISNATLGRIQSVYEDAGTNSYMAFQTRMAGTPTEQMRIDSSGNVGIGTTSLTEDFEVSRASSPNIAIRATTESVGSATDLDFLTGSGVRANTNRVAIVRGKVTQADPSALQGELQFWTNTGDAITQQMTIDSTGNVGIGTTSPSSTLHVAGSGRISQGASGATASVDADEFVVEDDDNAGISILTPSNKTGNLFFGDTSNVSRGGFTYSRGPFPGTDSLKLRVGASDSLHFQDSGGINSETGAFLSSGGAWTSASGAQIEGDWVVASDAGAASTFAGTLGVGTTSPSSTLHVVGDGRFTTGGLFEGNTEVSLGTSGATASVDADEFVVEDDGNVGISILSSNQRSIYFGDSSAPNDGGFEYSATFFGKQMNIRVGGINALTVNSDGAVNSSTGAALSSNGAWLSASGAQIQGDWVVASDAGAASTFAGNVGIGTTSPSNTLHVAGSGRISQGASGATASADADELIVEDDDNAGISILTPAEKLGGIAFGRPTNNYAGGIVYNHLTGFNSMTLKVDEAATMVLFSGGSLGLSNGAGNYGGTWTDASSRELKQDIRGLSSEEAIQTLLELQPVEFAYKNLPDEKRLGFIAEDVPELVATNDRKGLSPMDIIGVITRVVQDQQLMVEKQQDVIAEMSARLLDLENDTRNE